MPFRKPPIPTDPVVAGPVTMFAQRPTVPEPTWDDIKEGRFAQTVWAMCTCGVTYDRDALPRHICVASPEQRRQREWQARERARADEAQRTMTRPCPLGCETFIRGGELHRCPPREMTLGEKAVAEVQAAALVRTLEGAGYSVQKKEEAQ